jgi:hypothetical protein
MSEKKLWFIVKILIGTLIIYSMFLNVKYSQSLMKLFKNETTNLYDNRNSIESIDKIAYSSDVTNAYKNTVLSNEQEKLGKIMDWFYNLDKYTIANKKIRTLSVDVSEEILHLNESLTSIKDKDISALNDSDKKSLSKYKVFLQTLSENTPKISKAVKEDVVIPIYTRSHIEKYIFNIGNAVID